MSNVNDTICAQATPPGRGGVGVIRISGPLAKKIANEMLGFSPRPRFAHYTPFYSTDKTVIDVGIVLFFENPHSFTGEDVIEFQGHGGPVVMDMLLQTIMSQGARLAKPGEFSERAFLNDKMDLTQTEAIADLINASSQEAARCAVRSLQGEFSNAINQLLEKLTQLRMYVESAIDFPEEEIDFLDEGKVVEKLQDLIHEFKLIHEKAVHGARMNEGATLVIAGKPNAGKSTLLNALSGTDVAIVTEIPGTTRDVMREHIVIDGIPINIIDTAGLRQSHDVVEIEGIRRAKMEIEKADRILLVIDKSHDSDADIAKQYAELSTYLPNTIPVTIIANKVDKFHLPASLEQHENMDVLNISAKNHIGISMLRTYLSEKIKGTALVEGVFLARRRHLDALARVEIALHQGYEQLLKHKAGELLAYDLAQAQQALSEITGVFSADDLLGVIFSEFCVGK